MCLPAPYLMTSLITGEMKASAKEAPPFHNRIVGLEIDPLIFDSAPEAIDEDLSCQRPLPSMLWSALWASETTGKAQTMSAREARFSPQRERWTILPAT